MSLVYYNDGFNIPFYKFAVKETETYMKRFITLVALLLVAFVQTQAVLKEKDLARTLGVLRAELENNYREQKVNIARYEQSNKLQHAQLIRFMQQSDQIALMLYSQKSDFTFDLTYACQAATEQYKKLKENNLPYNEIRERMKVEIERYDGLIKSLKELPPAVDNSKRIHPHDSVHFDIPDSIMKQADVAPFLLNEQERADRDTCLLFAKALRNNLVRLMNAVLEDSKHYEEVTQKIERLNDYAMSRYDKLQKSIFVNGGENYFSMLSRLGTNYNLAKKDVSDKYMPFKQKRSSSEWRGPIIMSVSIFILFYIFIAALLSNILLRWILPKRIRGGEQFKKKRPLLLLVCGVTIFALVVMVAKLSIRQNFILMATNLMINIAWLMDAIFLSLLIRLSGQQIKAGMRVYMPFLIMAFLVIIFRIILIPNNVVGLIYPPLLLACTVWQYYVLKRRIERIPESDTIYSAVSLVAMIAATVVAWAGYVLLAVQIMIWWIFQLAVIQTITCCYDLTRIYEMRFIIHKIVATLGDDMSKLSRHQIIEKAHKGDFIYQTWLFDLVTRSVIPVLGVVSALVSIYWAADVFDMTAICRELFFYDFINKPGVIQLSLFKICLVTACWFVFRYINYLFRSVYRKYKERHKLPDEQLNLTLANNLIAILVWGSYFIFALILLQVPKSGISIVTAGLATGLGFAMKDLLENFIYGISLMTGRVRVGDYIECDGILGKVDSITYQSTQIITADGSIIAFLNASLFNKNFKNLTRNHSYELVSVPIGVAYGTDVNKVRKVLIDAITPLMHKNAEGKDIVNLATGVKVAFSNFGDSSIDLSVIFWVLVQEKIGFVAQVKETIYNTLNAHNIEMPFPQRDVYIRKVADVPVVEKKPQ